MAETPSNKEEEMVDTGDSGSSKGHLTNNERTEEMVELRRKRHAQLDYRQLHKTGSRRKTERDARVVCVNLDHGYCAKTPSLLEIREPTKKALDVVELCAKSSGFLETCGVGAQRELDFRQDTKTPNSLENMGNVVDGAQHEIELFKNRVEKGEMENLFGLSLSDWEDDPEVAERVRSLGEVLGLARDLNISIDDLNLGQQDDSANTHNTNTHGANTLSTSQKEYFDMPVIGTDFSMVQEGLHREYTHESNTNTAQPKSSLSFPKNVRFDATEGTRRKTLRSKSAGKATSSRKSSKRGRKPSKIDVKAKLERSRQSARECRARKKLRYQYLEELVASRERAVYQLRSELEQFKKWAVEVDEGTTPPGIEDYLERERVRKERSTSDCSVNSYVIRSRRRLTTGERTESESSVSSACMSVQSAQSPM